MMSSERLSRYAVEAKVGTIDRTCRLDGLAIRQTSNGSNGSCLCAISQLRSKMIALISSRLYGSPHVEP
jgi:hypothetical protein